MSFFPTSSTRTSLLSLFLCISLSVMAQKHRKLFPTNSTDCEIFPCDAFPEIPPVPEFLFPDILPPPPPSPPLFSSSATITLSPYLIIFLSIFAAVCMLLAAYVVLAKRCFRRRRQGYHDGEHDFLDHNHGPEIDHPIWYINTVGLQSSVINSIAIFKYQKGNNPIKETTCSVCLSEFVEDETLRLLPKCKHAFHIACIDTWLRSHTNCPLCRALILSNATRESLDETSNENANSMYNADVSGNLGIANENTRERETEDMSGSKEISLSSVVSLIREKGKRSISMDSLMAVSIGSGSCDFSVDQLHGNLVASRDEKQFDNSRTRYNGNLRIDSSSSVESLHMSPVSMKRSFSCSGRLFSSSRYNNKSSSSILPR